MEQRQIELIVIDVKKINDVNCAKMTLMYLSVRVVKYLHKFKFGFLF